MALSQNTRVIGSRILAPDQSVSTLVQVRRIAAKSWYGPYIMTLLLNLELSLRDLVLSFTEGLMTSRLDYLQTKTKLSRD